MKPKRALSLPQAFSKLYKEEKSLRTKFEEEYPQFKATADDDDGGDVDGDDSDEDQGESAEVRKVGRKATRTKSKAKMA